MLSQISEHKMHIIRWVLVLGWLLLIISLFYDPISHQLTDPDNLLSPFRDQTINLAHSPDTCVQVQGKCLSETPYPLGTRLFWGMIVPLAIAVIFVLGHETWRRICPLYFLSQIPRALGLQPIFNIENNRWLRHNHLYLQFALLFVGLNSRILFINSARPMLGYFLILTIYAAISTVTLYGGRTWCHYVCPFGLVQMVFTGPRGLLDSQAHKTPPRSITQSMCRTVDEVSGEEKSTCINCKSACFDIDGEKAYWESLTKPGRRFVQYGYLGLAIGYFIYYYLYAGNFEYYFSGAWTHEENQLASLLQPGFYLFSQTIGIPKLVAVPLTLASFVGISYFIGSKIEKRLFTYLRRHDSNIDRQHILHKTFTLSTFVAFNAFFIYGGRPEILRLPLLMQLVFNACVVLVSTLWLYRTWDRSAQQYTKECLANKLRRQLTKLSFDFSQFLEGRSFQDLNPEELYVLATVLPGATQQDRARIYRGILEEALEERRFAPHNSQAALSQLRQKLQLSEAEHDLILTDLIRENPALIQPIARQNSQFGLANTQLKNSQSGQRLSNPKQLTQIKTGKSKKPGSYSQDSPTLIKRSDPMSHESNGLD